MALRAVQPKEARAFLVKHLHLHTFFPPGVPGVRAMLDHLRCVQIDPLNPMGTNHDLVTMARVPGVKRGEMGHLIRGHAFEHWSKERCFIPTSAFPAYQRHAPETVWWKTEVRTERVSEAIVNAVLAEVAVKGPCRAADLADRGSVKPMDWSGWKSTAKATSMALDILWTQYEAQRKIYDLPRALDATSLTAGLIPHTQQEFVKWAILERVHSAGFLCRSSGSYWSILASHRDSAAVNELIADGSVEEVQIEGYSRRYLAPRGWHEKVFAEFDDEARILGPLDPLLWDRTLLQHVFDFEYIWECYKPVESRRWGYYVCPVLYRESFLGRIEGDVKAGVFTVRKVWLEKKLSQVEEAALRRALQRHAVACTATLALEASLEWKEPEVKIIATPKLRRSLSEGSGTHKQKKVAKPKAKAKRIKKQRDEEDEEELESDSPSEEKPQPLRKQKKQMSTPNLKRRCSNKSNAEDESFAPEDKPKKRSSKVSKE